jgi:hypothetical protein
MKSIEDTLEAIKVNLAENRKPRQTIPTSLMNVWCGARLLCERGAWSGERGAGTLRAGSRN